MLVEYIRGYDVDAYLAMLSSTSFPEIFLKELAHTIIDYDICTKYLKI